MMRLGRNLRTVYSQHAARAIRTTRVGALATRPIASLAPLDTYARRHNGSEGHRADMLKFIGEPSTASFLQKVVPKDILIERPLKVSPSQGLSESQLTARLHEIASKNQIKKSFIGKGYYGTITPPVIQRNVLECPEWYTSYTPYQAEISQGRLESLVNFQTLVADLTGMAIANSSLLDEGTAAGEAMTMSFHASKDKKKVYLVDSGVHIQTINVLKSRAAGFGIDVQVRDLTSVKEIGDDVCGVLAQYPSTNGQINDWSELSSLVHAKKGVVTIASDLLALTVLRPPSEFGADIVVGSAQRFGVPFGYGGPHAAFFAVSDTEKRKMPGRIIGKSKDRLGNPAYRLALQTREQHIRREKATSNICTAQALLANMSAFYAIYHGPDGLKDIATRVHSLTTILANGINSSSDNKVLNTNWFDTLSIQTTEPADVVIKRALEEYDINLFKAGANEVHLSLDETATIEDVKNLTQVFGGKEQEAAISQVSPAFSRSNEILDYPVFKTHHSETELLRYMHHLQRKDLSLADSMIPLGSCTMKLNATVTMAPITWPEFSNIHPFVPLDQAQGYEELIEELATDLSDITGFAATSLQPNSGANGEYTGLRVIRSYLEANGQGHRNICLIPVSAHGTNPASATMAGLKVVSIKCLANGELDLADVEAKAEKYKDNLAAAMITYPSTFGCFEPNVKAAIDIVHSHGGQVYMDGANMNAQVGLTSPGEIGADVCHLNLHKTFCIPHGGGGPGMGPICVKEHLAPHLPKHSVVDMSPSFLTKSTEKSIDAVTSAPYSSASILPIPWAYIKLMGAVGLKEATEMALLNANYMRKKLEGHYDILYTNVEGMCAHEFILDARNFKKTSGVEAIDIAKRLQDYGFHAPTMSWPVANTLMVEPTESENLAELDRFCEALISIRQEIKAIEEGSVPKENNLLKNAPHTQADLLRGDWDRPYTREEAAYPLPYLREKKFWATVARVDDTYGDLNLFCSCDKVDVLE